jgi:hypothetical protein
MRPHSAPQYRPAGVELWNSNSVIAWLLAVATKQDGRRPVAAARPPVG